MTDLIERLREVGGISDSGATRWYINPDGPEAANRIEKLEARILLLEGWLNGSLNIIEAFVAADTKEARKALEGKDD